MNDGGPNIISVLNHGWINTGQQCFFDMELCTMNLNDFITGHRAKGKSLNTQDYDPKGKGDIIEIDAMPISLMDQLNTRHIPLGEQWVQRFLFRHLQLKSVVTVRMEASKSI
jgi:hypothetical protein